jgi:TolB protein
MKVGFLAGVVLIPVTVGAACGSKGDGWPLMSSLEGAAVGGQVSPRGKIAFVSFRDGNQEIYVMNADGSDERNLTNHPADDFDPDWSPDGTRLVFVSKRTGQPHVYLMDADGSDVRRLTGHRSGGLSPRWSRGGQQIVFSRAGSLVVMTPDGDNMRVIMEAEPEATAAACRAGAFAGGWSPDDEQITYYAASVSRQRGEVCTIKADGSEIQAVVCDPATYQVEPVFSPDGRSIAYRAIVAGVHDIWVVDLETGGRTNITNDPEVDVEPSWSPDGEWIAFASLKPGQPNFEIYVMRKDGSEERRLTLEPAKDAYPAWAPRSATECR